MKKRSIWVSLVMVLIFSLMLTGCSSNERAIYDASMKMAEVNSMESNVKISLNLSGSGLDEASQGELDSIAAILNGSSIEFDMKIDSNDDNTLLKSEVDMLLKGLGQEINVPYWIEMDLESDEPKFVEIFKIPEILVPYLPTEYADKEYMVLNLMATEDENLQPIDMAGLMDFSMGFQEEQIKFFNSYAERFKPNLNVTRKSTEDGKQYTIKLDDKEFKDFIRYSVNHFAKDEEALEFVTDYMAAMSGLSGSPESQDEIKEALSQENIDKFLVEFNKVMDQLDDFTLLGDKGIQLTYTISNAGYIVKDHTIIDLKVDLAQLDSLLASIDLEANEPEELKGVINFTIDIETVNKNINKPLKIKLPEINSSNSVDYMDFIKVSIDESMEVTEDPFRFAGDNRYQTARIIAEKFNDGLCENIILTSGTSFADTISATLLSKKLDAPILFVGPTVESSAEAFAYIAQHSDQNTKVYLVGGKGAVSEQIEGKLKNDGYSIERLSGDSSFATNIAVLNKVELAPGTPMLIASGVSYPDSLSVASLAGMRDYSLVLVGKDNISAETKDYIANNKPSTVYIVGGEGVISKSVEDQIKSLSPETFVKRLAGQDRFSTSMAVINEFNPGLDNIYLANGYNFADALAGSTLAIKAEAPVLLVDPNQEGLPAAYSTLLNKARDERYFPIVWTLGGEQVVPERMVYDILDIVYE